MFGKKPKKEEKKEKKDISKLRKYLQKATEAGFVKWTLTDREAVDTYYGTVVKGYETTLPNGKTIEIIVLPGPVYGLSIKNGSEELVFTSDTKVLPGEKPKDDIELLIIAVSINGIAKDKSLMSAINQELAGLIYGE